MPDPTPTYLDGCDFSALSSSALAGKDIIALVTDSVGTSILAIAGQQSANFNINVETSSTSATKDSAAGAWSVSFHGTKSWEASIDGLYSIGDSAHEMILKALANSEYLCLKICKREIETTTTDSGTTTTTTYTPLRMGLAIATSDNLTAGTDDSATYSLSFTGNGAAWLYETATSAEREAATIVIEG